MNKTCLSNNHNLNLCYTKFLFIEEHQNFYLIKLKILTIKVNFLNSFGYI